MRFGYFKLGGYIAYKYFLSEIFTYVSECLPEQNVASAVSRQSFCVANQIFKKLCDYNGNGAFHDNVFKFSAFFIFVHNISEHKENLVIAFVIQYGKVRRFFISYFVIKTVLDKLGKKRKRVEEVTLFSFEGTQRKQICEKRVCAEILVQCKAER